MADRVCQTLSLSTESNAVLKSINSSKRLPRFLDKDLFLMFEVQMPCQLCCILREKPACDSPTQLYILVLYVTRLLMTLQIFP